jgi:NAD(P)-dependent dehydrogenase (short-subunit alcohol dehydrogenase family)
MVTRMLADDLRERGIIVATISPPPTETDMLRALIGPEGASRQAKPADVIARLIKVIDGLTLESSGADVRPRDEAALVELSMVGRI